MAIGQDTMDFQECSTLYKKNDGSTNTTGNTFNVLLLNSKHY